MDLLWKALHQEAEQAIEKEINDINFMIRHRTNPAYFVRCSGRYTFAQLTEHILYGNMAKLDASLRCFASSSDIQKVSTSAIGQQRQRISPDAFEALNHMVIKIAYEKECVRQNFYNGYAVFLMKQDELKLLATERLQEEFGRVYEDGQKSVFAKACALVDIGNGLTISGTLKGGREKLREMAAWTLERAQMSYEGDGLIFFEKAFYSHSLLHYLQTNGVLFVFEAEKAEIAALRSEVRDGVVFLRRQGVEIPFSVIEFDEETVLITNAYESFSKEELIKLYKKVKKCRGSMIDTRLFTGNTPSAIYQDYYSVMLIENLKSIIKHYKGE